MVKTMADATITSSNGTFQSSIFALIVFVVFTRSLVLTELSPEFCKCVVKCHSLMPSGDSIILLSLVGGQVSRVPHDSTAVAHRAGKYWLIIQGYIILVACYFFTLSYCLPSNPKILGKKAQRMHTRDAYTSSELGQGLL
jgi:hypothetical protein